MRVRWIDPANPAQEYDPETDEALAEEAEAEFEHWAPGCDANGNHPCCALHINGAWHSRFENLSIFVPKKSVAVLADAFRESGGGSGINPFFGATGITHYDDWDVYCPYNEYPGLGQNEPQENDTDDRIVNIDAEQLCAWGTYACALSGIGACNGLVVVYGNQPPSVGGVTTCTFRDIWARRYVMRFAMGLTFTNCTAEGFSGTCPAFDLDPANVDHRITFPDAEGNPTSSPTGWWNEFRAELFRDNRMFDGRESGYLLSDCTTVQLIGCDIEDWAGLSCLRLGPNTDNINAIGISAGLYTTRPNARLLIGRPNRTGSCIATSGIQMFWGQSQAEYLPYAGYHKSGGSSIQLGCLNDDAVDDGRTFRFRIRARNPMDTSTEDISHLQYPNAGDAAEYYPSHDQDQVLEFSRMLARASGNTAPPDEPVFLAVSRENRSVPHPITNRTGAATRIRIDAGRMIDGGTNRVELNADAIVVCGTPVFHESSHIPGTVPSSLTSSLPGTVSAWLPIWVKTSVDPDPETYAEYFLPLYLP